MKKKHIKKNNELAILLIVLFLVYGFANFLPINYDNLEEETHIKPKILATNTDIMINDLLTTNTTYMGNWSWARTQSWCTQGLGTPGDPYIIEDETFIYNSVGPESLRIFNSREHFIIRNCLITDSHPIWAGFYLDNVTNGQILNNDVVDNGYGIVIIDVNDTIISDNNISIYSSNGLLIIGDSDNNIITGNIINGNGGAYGIEVNVGSDNNLFYNNYITNHTVSNAIDDGANNDWNNSVIGNYWDDYNGYDMDLDGIGDNPYSITGSAGNFDFLPIWNIQGPIAINDLPGSLNNWTWAVSQAWCSGSGTDLNPYIIDDLNIDGNITDSCISVLNSEAHFIIQDCSLNNSGVTDAGIYLNNVSNGNIIGNNFNIHQNAAIAVTLSDHNTVSGNSLNNFTLGIEIVGSHNEVLDNKLYGAVLGPGIYLHGGLSDNIINGNIIENCHNGIWIDGANNNSVSGNEISNNTGEGIVIFTNFNFLSGNIVVNSGQRGIYLIWANENTIKNTLIRGSKLQGIIVEDSDDNIFYDNEIRDNIITGVSITGSSVGNSFYRNFFINNTDHAIDNGVSNDWNNTIIGNYWDDYIGYDMDLDGIGDDPYNITGSAGNLDFLPIWNIQAPIAINDLPGSLNNWTWAVSQAWCSGSGTSGDPFVIEDLIIDGNGTHSCITILNSNKHFIIRNCKVYNSGTVLFASGILLFNVTNSQIIGNNASNNEFFGIALLDSEYNTISGNIANYNTMFGIILGDSNNNTISGNTANENLASDGIFLGGSYNNTVTGNTCNNNSAYGIHLEVSNFNSLSENIASDNPTSNFYLLNSDNNTLYRNIADEISDYGIFLESSDFNDIIECEAYNSIVCGIHLLASHNNSIVDCVAHFNFRGIYAYGSSENVISGNIANNNTQWGLGVYLSYNNSIIDNFAQYNLGLYGGIMVADSDYTLVENNHVFDNNLAGIYFWGDGDNSIVRENVIKDNINGIYLESQSDSNLFYENFFLKNGIHARDWGSNNDWNSTTIGNYWDNFTGPDVSPIDGIVDWPYNISGSAGSKDYLPIAEDGPPSIIINSPSEDDIFGTNTPSFSVIITDTFLDITWYTLDGGLNNYSFTGLTGFIDQSAWDAMPDGVITLKFYASDNPGNIGSAEVNIEKDSQAPIIIINSPSTADAYGAGAPSFIVEISDENLDTMWYSLDGGLTNFTFTTNGTVNQAAWSALSEGSVTVTFYANDTIGNFASETVNVEKDIEPPGNNFIIIIIVVSVVIGAVIITVVIVIVLKKRRAGEEI